MLDCIASGEFHIYAPPLGLEELRALILEDLGLAAGSFEAIVTDGAIEGLYHACRTLMHPGEEMLVADPGWLWPRAFAREAGAKVIEVPIYDPACGYRLRIEDLEAAVTDDTKLIYLVDPNNPTGAIQTRQEIEAIARIAQKAGIYVIHDCTYRHFAQGHTLLAPHYPEGTLTTYSFSKWLGLAGLRVGAIIAAPELAARLATAPPNNLGSSILAQRAAIAGLRTKEDWFPAVDAAQRENQERIRKAAQSIGGYEFAVYPSHGNFLCMDVTGAGVSPEALCERYLQRDILIRQGSYHTKRFAERFVKISTTVPLAWAESFCDLLPVATEEARSMKTVSALY
jgi:aspartate/methionine/tyrosine aminotransferase